MWGTHGGKQPSNMGLEVYIGGLKIASGWHTVKGKCLPGRECPVQTSKWCFWEGQFLYCCWQGWILIRSPYKRLGIFCAWRELVGIVTFIHFQSFKLTWRLPVSNLRLTAWGGCFQATVTGADCCGFVFSGARQQSTAETQWRLRQRGCF